MRQFYTSVLERRKTFAGPVETPPFEGGWAGEALFFVRVESIAPGAAVNLRVQISPDGMHWIDEGTAFPPLDRAGDAFVRVSPFDGWLRLAGEASTAVSLTIHLALQE